MPVHKATGPRGGKGYQYGETGKVYPTRAQAVKQAQAIKASQAAAKKKKQSVLDPLKGIDINKLTNNS